MIFSNLLRSLRGEQEEETTDSIAVLDQVVIESFLMECKNTIFVSFPRTGSHWLRMIMELYFDRPSLVRVFYYPEKSNYLTLHTHDKDLSVERDNVLYLYRDPVETIYSQLNYYKEDIHDHTRIVYWADQYGQHLDKWLYSETFTKKKTVLTYEGMKCDMVNEFGKITDHFGEKLDVKALKKATDRITKDEVKRKTGHDPQVVQLKTDYGDLRNNFRMLHGRLVWDSVLTNRIHLESFFKHL